MTRVSFWGSPEISAVLLERLVKTPEIEIEFVVTQEDKPRSYRGRQDEPTAVKKKANEFNIPVFTPKSLKKNSDDLYKQLAQFDVDVNIVFAYGKIIPERFFALPRHGSLNFHASLLPRFRGASPIEQALLEGDEKTGWTMQKMVEKLDAGDIYYTHEVEVKWEDDFSSLLERLITELVRFAPEVIGKYARGELSGMPQNDDEATHCGKIDPEMGKVDWFLPYLKIRNLARAMANRGGLYSFYNNRKCKLFVDLSVDKATILKTSGGEKPPGSISQITDDLLWVACNDSHNIPIKFIQPEGKKKLTVKEFVNGYRVQTGDRFNAFTG